MFFYPASAYRRNATHHDIIEGKVFTSFNAAQRFVSDYGHDSDDIVFININGEWLIVWDQGEDGVLFVSGEHQGANKAVPLHVYLDR